MNQSLLIVNAKHVGKLKVIVELLGQINLFKQIEDNHVVGLTLDKKLIL